MPARSTHRPLTCDLRLGFTLIELLVVITILVLLLALLAPALDRAISAAEKVRCGGNLHAIGTATFQYALDGKRRLPPAVNDSDGGAGDFANPAGGQYAPNFLDSIIPYLGGSRAPFLCPVIHPTLFDWQTPTLLSDTNYQGNGALYGRTLARVGGAGPAVLVQELRDRTSYAWYRPFTRNNSGTYVSWHWDDGLKRHEVYGVSHDFDLNAPLGSGGAAGGNLLWTDGRVEYRVGAELRAGDFGLTGDGISGDASDTHDAMDNRTYRSKLE